MLTMGDTYKRPTTHRETDRAGTAPDVWLPLNLARQLGDNVRCFDQPECTFMLVMGRLRPEISLPQAEAALRVTRGPAWKPP